MRQCFAVNAVYVVVESQTCGGRLITRVDDLSGQSCAWIPKSARQPASGLAHEKGVSDE